MCHDLCTFLVFEFSTVQVSIIWLSNISSEWVNDYCLTPTQQQLYHGENNLNFRWEDDEVRFVLYQYAQLDFFYSARSLKQSAESHVTHSDTLSVFRANQSLLFLLNAACLAEKQQIPILLSLFLPARGANPRSTALEASTQTITPPMRLQYFDIKCILMKTIPEIRNEKGSLIYLFIKLVQIH